jgi:hypothetical protein
MEPTKKFQSSYLLFAAMVCGFCHSAGHTIKSCQAPGAEEERVKRESDPKLLKAREKAKEKRIQKNAQEVNRLEVTSQPSPLPHPTVTPGVIKEIHGEAALSVDGAINLALPPSYLDKILKIINENR